MSKRPRQEINLRIPYAPDLEWLAKARLATSSLRLRERYGDIFRLDAFPWIMYADDSLQDALEQRDAFDGPQGRVSRYWRVTGGDGLGRPSERNLYLALLEMTAEAGWENSSIQFTYSALALRLGMRPDKKAYQKIADMLACLAQLTVQFHGTAEVSPDDTEGVTVLFPIVSDLHKVTENGEVDCTLSWGNEVYRSLESAVQALQASTPELSLDEIMSSFFVPLDPERTRPQRT